MILPQQNTSLTYFLLFSCIPLFFRSAVLIAAAAMGIHGLPVSGTGQNQEALLNGVQAEWTDDIGKEYPEEEFF